MEGQTQIMEMTHLNKEEILREITKLFNQSNIHKFTLLLQHSPLKPEQQNYNYSYQIEQINKIFNRKQSPSVIDKYYKHSISVRKNTNHNQDSRFYGQSKSIMDFEDFSQTPKSLAINFYRQGQINEATQIFEELKKGLPQENRSELQQKEYKQILNHLGNCYFKSQRIERAVQIYKIILKQQQNLGNNNSKQVGQLYNNLGCCYGKLGFDKLSMNSYSSALKIYSKFNQVDSSPLLNNIANIYFNSEMFDIAEKYYLEAISQRQNKKPNEKQLLFYAHYKLGLAQMKQFKYRQALQNLGKALKLTTNKYGDPSQILKQCAYIKQVQNKWSEALEFYQKIYQIYENNKKNKGFLFEKVARIYSNIGREAQHKKYINLSLSQYKKQGNERKLSQLSNNRHILHNLINTTIT